MEVNYRSCNQSTIISNIMTNLWWEPYVVYKEYFGKKIYLYFKEYIQYVIVLILSVLPMLFVKNILTVSIINFIILLMITVIWTNFIMIICFYRKKEFIFYKKLVYEYLKKIRGC